MFDKLDSIEKRFKELEAQLSDSAVMQDMKKYSELMKEHASTKEPISFSGTSSLRALCF